MRGKRRIILERKILEDYIILEEMWNYYTIKSLKIQVTKLEDQVTFWHETSEDYKRIIYEQFSKIRQYKKLLKLPNLPVMP